MYYGSYTWSLEPNTVETDNDGSNYSKAAGVTKGLACFGTTHISDNRLRFDVPGVYFVQMSFSASASAATAAEIALARNGEVMPETNILRTISTGSTSGAGSLSIMYSFLKGDYIEVWCKSDQATDDITIQTGVVSAFKVN